MKEYVLVSQGIEIYRTTDKDEANFIMERDNQLSDKRRMEYDDDEDYYVDNSIEMYEEDKS